MIKFSDYLNQYKRKFVALSFSDSTVTSLRKYCEENGFDLSNRHDGTKQAPEAFKFHTTIFYTFISIYFVNTFLSQNPDSI